MIFFLDIDGTLSSVQKTKSVFKCPLRQDVIDKVKKLQSEGHEIVLWSGSSKYAFAVSQQLGINAIACVRKPDIIVDNQVGRWGKRLKNRTISPEDFLVKDFSKKEK
jgi:hydroxymethylpyrimidine pyrophosphatase-like HAD family hydrolase